MAGDQPRLLVEPLFVAAGQDLGRRPVHRLTRLGELRVIGDVLRERMLEAVFGLGVGRALVDELGHAQASQPLAHLAAVQLEELLHERFAKAPPHHRGDLEQVLFPVGETIDAGGEYSLNGGGDTDLGHIARQPVGTPLADEGVVLGEGVDHLLDEEWVAGGAVANSFAELVQTRAVAEQVAQQLGELGFAEGAQRDLLIVRVPRPIGAVLGPEVHEQQRARAGQRLDQVGDERLAGTIDPVEILDHDDSRLAARARGDGTARDTEELTLALLGFERRGRLLRIGYAHELEDEREVARELGVEL